MADVKIDVKVDDRGSLKKVGKSAQSARRQIGGVARTASAGGKQFSKMSQGITGGLVPAYAQLAATLFAVDAVFRALKDAADLRVQREGMIAYAQTTGVALQSVAIGLQKATDAQLSFKEAASGAAIGVAAGLSATQMEAIGTAARNASVALGRNFTDSFDRVLKGIVKGEPELLDELGIILRLETATRKYALAMGLTQDKLTAWQRSQAVFNEVIGQATEKYAALGDGVEVSGIVQMATALEDIKNTAMEAIAPIAEFFAGVFTNNIKAAIALLLVFAASILNKIVPSIRTMKGEIATLGAGMGAGFKRGVGGLALAGGQIKGAYQTATATPARLASRTQKAAGAVGPHKSAMVQQLADGKALNKAQLGQTKAMLKRAEAQWKKHGVITTGAMAGADGEKLRHLRQSIKNMDSAVTRHGVVWKSMWGGVKVATKVTMMTLVGIVKGAFGVMKIAAKGLGMAMNAAMRMAGFIGMAVMMWEMWKSLKERMDKILIWIGTKLKWIANKFKEIGAGLKKTGIGYIAGTALEGLGNLADGWGDAALAKGEYMSEALKEERRIKAVKKGIDDLTVSIEKSTPELKKMIKEYKKGFDDLWDRRKWEANFTKTMGSGFQSELASLLGIAEGGNIDMAGESIKLLSEKLKDAAAIDVRYGEIADDLLKMTAAGTLTEKAIRDLLNTLNQTNNDAGLTGNAMESLNQLTEDYGRLIGELNKGLGQTKWDKLTKNLRQTMIEMTGIRDREQVGLNDMFKNRRKAFLDANDVLADAVRAEKTLLLGHKQEIANIYSTMGKGAQYEAIQLITPHALERQAAKDAIKAAGEAMQATLGPLAQADEFALAGIMDLKLTDPKFLEDKDNINQMQELAKSWFGSEAAAKLDTFGLLYNKLNEQLTFYKDLQAEARDIQLDGIQLQMDMMEASKWKGPLGQLLKEEVTTEKKLLALRQKQNTLLEVQESLRIARVGELGEGEIRSVKVEAAEHALRVAEGAVSLAERELEIYKESVRIGFKFANDLQAGFTNLWNNVIDGTKSLKDVLKATFRTIFIQLAQMIAQMLMVKALQAAIGWWNAPWTSPIDPAAGAGGTFGGMPLSGVPVPGATGGIVGKNKIGYFGHGGLAKSLAKGTDTVPAMLTPGETVLTPSQLKNLVHNSAAMGTNNVTVNVSAQGQQQTTSNSSNQQAEIGRMIADAVTATLIEEQRPGGVLSPFGGGGP